MYLQFLDFPKMTPLSPRVHLKPLTGLRFVAAVSVVIYHFGTVVVTHGVGPWAFVQTVARNVANTGLVGVNCFFILSGFILSYTYLDESGRLRSSRRDFFAARVARIYPIYLVGFILSVGPFLWYADAPTRRLLIVAIVPALTLTHAWVPSLVNTWNGPSWSLSAEAFFYILFPLLGMEIGRLNRKQLWRTLRVLCFIMLATPIAYMILVPNHDAIQGDLSSNYWAQVLWTNPLSRLPEFLLGVTLGRIFVLRPASHGVAQPGHVPRPGRLAGAALAATGVVMACAPLIPNALLVHAVPALLFAALIYGLACDASHRRRHVTAFLSQPAMVVLGEASYGMYILHAPIWLWLTHFLGQSNATDSMRLVFFLDYLALLIALSLLALRFLERPARRAIRQAFCRARAAGDSPPRWRLDHDTAQIRMAPGSVGRPQSD